jgi:hypothetical protein
MNPRALVVVLGLAAACGDNATRPEISSAVQHRSLAVAAGASAADTASSAPSSSYWANQKLIRSADVRLRVRDVPVALRQADSIAQSVGALVADSHMIQDSEDKRTADVVFRVPATQFAALLRGLRGMGSVVAESIGTQDVTKEYTDLETRVTVKEQTVTRLRGLLDTRTAKLADVLEVERELSREVAELEQMKGQQRYYDQQIALSTVRLTLFEQLPSRIGQAAKPIIDALSSSLELLGNSIGTIIYLAVAIMPWVVVALGIVWLVPAWRRRLLSREAGTEPPAAS